MRSTAIRISDKSRQLLRELASRERLSMQAILDKALEAYRRQCCLESVHATYAEVRQTHGAWQEIEQERKLWDTTLTDGLDPGEMWTEARDVHRITPPNCSLTTQLTRGDIQLADLNPTRGHAGRTVSIFLTE